MSKNRSREKKYTLTMSKQIVSRHLFLCLYYSTLNTYNSNMIELRQCSSREEWDDFVLENGGHPLQLWGWGMLKEKHGWKCDRLIGYQYDEPVAAISVLTLKVAKPLNGFSYSPRGPVGAGASAEFLEEVANYIRKKRHSVCLSIEPDAKEFSSIDLWQPSSNSVLPALTIQLDLRESESELLAKMAKKTRQYIRKSDADVDIRRVKTIVELDKCLDIYKETSKRADFALHSVGYYHDVFHSLGDHSLIYGAYVDDEPVAFLWLAVSADVAFELYGGMNDRGQELRANYALKWNAIKATKQWGLTTYDFGGLIGEGIATFKRSWTDGDTVLAGTFDRPLSPLYPIWSKALPRAKKAAQKLRSLKR